jgi:hypothetical protein
MTIRGWDTSHFDGPISRATTDRAYAEGIRFLTAKVAEGLQDTEGAQDDTTLANARASGIPFLAPYFIPRSNAAPADQVAEWMKLLNAGEPWWRDFPGMFVQIDLERWPYDSVPASVGIECGQRIRDAMGRQALLYASRGQYGDGLTAWDGPLWNADYWSPATYPGDNFTHNDKGAPAGWAPYSGKVPAILQWTSSATIAGLTTCDENAFRGTINDFATLIGASMLTPSQEVELLRNAHNADWGITQILNGTEPAKDFEQSDGTLFTTPNVLHQRLRAILTAVQSVSGGGLSDADRALIQADIDAITANTAAANALKASVDALAHQLSSP